MLTGIIKSLNDLIWGKKATVSNSRIGLLSSRVKSTDPSRSYTWTSNQLLPGQSLPTFFIVEGNYLGPFPHQLQSIYQILDMLPAIMENADRELRRNAHTYENLKDWKNTFYCAAITPLDVEQREFELDFEPADESDTRYVLVSWKNGQLTEIEGK